MNDTRLLDYVTKISIPDSLRGNYDATFSALRELRKLAEDSPQVYIIRQYKSQWELYVDLYLIWNDKEFRYEIVNEIDYEKYPKYLWDENFEPRVFKFYEDLKDFVYDFIPYRYMPKDLL